MFFSQLTEIEWNSQDAAGKWLPVFLCYVTKKKKRFKANAENLFHEITEEMNEKYKIVPTPHLYHYQ